ncbi:MAG TPA: pyrroline-5-carboxylate reductase [Hyphomonas sp.]|nr:pyrroline-5-carboxylate reductase [Hyphomonas sp.]
MSALPSIALVGAGRMGSALASGWLSGKGKRDIRIAEPTAGETVQAWAAAGKVQLNPEPSPVEVLVVAVKPQVFPKVAESLKPWIGPETLVVSIMAGTRIKQLSERLGTDRVIRVMPNTPGSIGKGVSVMSALPTITVADISITRTLLEPLGEVVGPVDEKHMSVVTGLSGSGPAYVFLLAEAMTDAAIAEGLPADIAAQLSRLTVEGAAALMAQSEEAPDALRKAVTSPGGTTQAALDILMDEGGMPGLMRKAIRAAANRDRELSRDTD